MLNLIAASFIITACQSQEPIKNLTVSQTIEQLKLAVNNKDFGDISNYLSDEYKYQDIGRPMATSILKQVIQQFPNIDSIGINEITNESQKLLINVSIYTKENTSNKTIILDENNRILSADIAAISLGHGSSSGGIQTQTSNETIEDSPFKTMPFYLSESQMVVEATINGKKGKFVVDSGTPMALMLNANFQNYKGAKSKNNPMDVSGNMDNTSDVMVDSFVWNGLTFSDVPAMSADLDDLGRRLNIESFAGTIGYAILKNYIVEFDYQENQLKLWNNREVLKEHYKVNTNQTVAFTMAHHIPVIKANIGNKQFRFGLDCGAETNMIEPEWQDHLQGRYEVIGMTALNGAGTSQREVLKVVMRDFILNEKSYTMNFMFAKLYGGQHEVTEMDGLIGNQFLAYRKTIVNYLDNEIYFLDSNL